jgi:hypothetical protein
MSCKKKHVTFLATELLPQNSFETFDIFIDIEIHCVSVSYFHRNVCKVMTYEFKSSSTSKLKWALSIYLDE